MINVQLSCDFNIKNYDMKCKFQNADHFVILGIVSY